MRASVSYEQGYLIHDDLPYRDLFDHPQASESQRNRKASPNEYSHADRRHELHFESQGF